MAVDEIYNLNSCLEQVRYEIEELHEDPIRLLGKYTLRAEQDPLFNNLMLTAIKQYIKDNSITWNYKKKTAENQQPKK